MIIIPPRLYFFIIAVIIFSISCKNEKNIDLRDFKDQKEIVGEIVNIEKELLFDPLDLIIIDSFLISLDPDNKKMIRIINLNSGQLDYNIVNRGKGPNELIDAITVHKTTNQNFILGTDKILSYNLSEIIRNNLTPEVVFLNKNERVDLDILRLNDSCFLTTSNFAFENKYSLLSNNGSVIQTKFKFDDSNIPFKYKKIAYQNYLAKHPNEQKFVMACINTPFFEIGTVKNNNIAIQKQYRYEKLNYKTNDYSNGFRGIEIDKDNVYGFLKLKVTSKYIYLLYSGKTEEEYDETLFLSSKILVYDWDGIPQKLLSLDQEVFSFAVDSEDKFIYATFFNPDPTLVKYNIK